MTRIVRLGILAAALASTVVLAQSAPDAAQPGPHGNSGYEVGSGGSFGWVGLLGLAGLAGLFRGSRRGPEDTRDSSSR